MQTNPAQARLPPDAAARSQALDPRQSFIVEAPAGSGKTELLTQRILTLLACVEQPECVLAITFTRKAAAEMRERLLEALQRGQGPEPSSPHQQSTWAMARAVLARDASLGWQLLQNPNRLQISTFDSLCARLTQALPLQSSLGPALRIAEDAQPLYDEAVASLLSILDNEPLPPRGAAANLVQLLGHLDNRQDRLGALLIAMLQKRDAWLPLVQALQQARSSGQGTQALRAWLESHLQTRIKDAVTDLARALEVAAWPRLAALADWACANLLAAGKDALAALEGLPTNKPPQGLQSLPQWLGLRQWLLTKEGQWRKRLDVNCGFPPGQSAAEKRQYKALKEEMLALLEPLHEQPSLLENLQNLAQLPASHYSDEQWQALEAVIELLPTLVAHLHWVFAQQSQLDFTEVALRARQALGDEGNPTDLALRLDYQIRHILVDEFQDTSASQYHLLQQLTAGWEPGDGRSLFCVGDAMQSIYSFRAANVGLFLYAKEQGLGHLPLYPLQLSANFRSDPQLVDWVNRVFQHAFPARSDFASGAVAYSQALAFRPAGHASLQCHSLDPAAGDRGEAQQVLAVIQQHWQEDPSLQIAILVRSRHHGQTLLQMAQAAGLNPLAVDMQALAQHPAVADALNLTRALLYPEDPIAWLALLRAPWAGFSLNDLSLVRASPGTSLLQQMRSLLDNPPQLQRLSSMAQARLGPITACLELALAERLRKPLRPWVEATWLHLGGASLVQQAADLDSLARYWWCLETLGQSGLPSLEQLNAALAQLYAAPAPDADPRLQIMTIHKSKGLEFDVVILPGLHRGGGRSEPALMLWQERLSRQGEEQLLVSALHPSHQNLDPIYQHLLHEQQHRDAYERCRVVYVACTRAKQHLHLLAQVSPAQDADQLRPPRKGSALHALWPGLHGHWPLPPQQPPGTAESPGSEARGDQATSLAPLLRLPEAWSPPAWPQGQLLSPYVAPFDFGRNDPAALLSPQDPLPRRLGEFIHQALKDMAEQSFAQWHSRSWASRWPIWRAQLRGQGLTQAQLDSLELPLQAQVEAIKNDPWLAERLAEPAHCRAEWPIAWQNPAGVIEQLRIDLLWEPAGQIPWLIDYKTAQPAPGQSLESFFNEQKSAHTSSLRRYRQALEHMGYSRVQAGLYFVVLQHWLPFLGESADDGL
jgi:ATP-dependent helicase/nuclease subunit A